VDADVAEMSVDQLSAELFCVTREGAPEALTFQPICFLAQEVGGDCVKGENLIKRKLKTLATLPESYNACVDVRSGRNYGINPVLRCREIFGKEMGDLHLASLGFHIITAYLPAPAPIAV
jgi:hypothetical protein